MGMRCLKLMLSNTSLCSEARLVYSFSMDYDFIISNDASRHPRAKHVPDSCRHIIIFQSLNCVFPLSVSSFKNIDLISFYDKVRNTVSDKWEYLLPKGWT